MRSPDNLQEFKSVDPNTFEGRQLQEELDRQVLALGNLDGKVPISGLEIAKLRKESLVDTDKWNPVHSASHLATLRRIESGARKPDQRKRTFAKAYNDYVYKQGYSRADALILAKTCPNTLPPVVSPDYKPKWKPRKTNV